MSELAIVVFSGGLDSTTALAEAVRSHPKWDVQAITFDYGQRHKVEIRAAQKLASYYEVRHIVVELNKELFAGGSLTTDEEVKDMRYDDLPDGTMSPTYVPFRNGNLISMAAAYADSVLKREDVVAAGVQDYPAWDSALIYCGMHAEDAAGFAYADCTPEFLGAMAAAVHVGTYGRVRLHALYQHRTKAEIIRRGINLLVPYDMTHSCYRGMRPACGRCSTCHARLEAFDVAGYEDPLPYEEAQDGRS